MSAPPPPPGFTIISGDAPPPPPGFSIIGQPEQDDTPSFVAGSERANLQTRVNDAGETEMHVNGNWVPAIQLPEDMGGGLVPNTRIREFDYPDLFTGAIEDEQGERVLSGSERVNVARAAFFGNDQDVAKALEESGAKIRTDKYGKLIADLPNGESRYISGTDLSDPRSAAAGAARAAGGVLPYVAGGVASSSLGSLMNLGRIAQPTLTGVVEGVTDYVAQKAAGREETDKAQTAVAVAAGAGAEAFTPFLVRTYRGIRNSLRGDEDWAQIGERVVNEAADQAGIDRATFENVPRDRLAELGRRLEYAPDELNVNAILGDAEFGTTTSRARMMPEGQARQAALAREEAVIKGRVSPELIDRNVEANPEALQQSLTGDFAARSQEDAAQMMRNQAQRAEEAAMTARRGAYREAFEGDADAVVLPEQLEELTGRVAAAPGRQLARRPGAQQVRQELADMQGLASPEGAMSVRDLEFTRQNLNEMRKGASGRDLEAIRRSQAEYDAALQQYFDEGLVRGDPATLAAMQNARGLWSDYIQRFDESTFVEKLIDDEVPPAQVAQILFGGSRTSMANSRKGAQLLREYKRAVGASDEVMQPVREMAMFKLTHSDTGDLLPYNRIASNLRSLFRENTALADEIFTPNAVSRLNRLTTHVENLGATLKGQPAAESGTAPRLLNMMRTTLENVPLAGGLFQGIVQSIRRRVMEAEQAFAPGMARAGAPGGYFASPDEDDEG